MGLDKLKKKKPNQLVSKRKDGKRPGYYGSDAGFGDYDDSPSSSGGGGGGSSDNGGSDNRENYISQQYTAPAPSYDTADFAFTTPSPSPQPDTSGDDQEDDVAQMMVSMGLTPDNAPTGFTSTTGEDGLGEGDYDDGRSLYTSPTQTMKDEAPYINYKPGPNYVTAQQLSNLNRGIGDSDERAATLANIQAFNPIQQPTGITAGTRLKNFAIDFGLNALTGGLYGRLKAPYKIAQAIDNRFFDDQIPGITKFAKYNKNPGTGFEKSTFEGDGDNRPKDVVTAGVQKYSPKLNAEQLNRAITIRDQLQSYAETGRLNKENQMTLTALNKLIEEYQPKLPETMSV